MAAQPQSIEGKIAAARAARPVYTYNIPKSLRGEEEAGPSSIGLTQLTAGQELTAAKIGRFDLTAQQYAAAKLSIVQLNGKPINNNEGDVDKFWDKCDPKLRSLIMQAYNRLTTPAKEDEESFFTSEQIKLG